MRGVKNITDANKNASDKTRTLACETCNASIVRLNLRGRRMNCKGERSYYGGVKLSFIAKKKLSVKRSVREEGNIPTRLSRPFVVFHNK